jgi:hypothetical protein
VLVPLDLSAASVHALNYAIPIVERFQAGLHLVYVHENGLNFSVDALSRISCTKALRSGKRSASRAASLIRAENCHVLIGRA